MIGMVRRWCRYHEKTAPILFRSPSFSLNLYTHAQLNDLPISQIRVAKTKPRAFSKEA
jgi:hypothetical protein